MTSFMSKDFVGNIFINWNYMFFLGTFLYIKKNINIISSYSSICLVYHDCFFSYVFILATNCMLPILRLLVYISTSSVWVYFKILQNRTRWHVIIYTDIYLFAACAKVKNKLSLYIYPNVLQSPTRKVCIKLLRLQNWLTCLFSGKNMISYMYAI